MSAVFFSCFPDEFDAAAVAEKLKLVADKLNNDKVFQAAMNDLTKAFAKEVGYIPLFAIICCIAVMECPVCRGATVKMINASHLV